MLPSVMACELRKEMTVGADGNVNIIHLCPCIDCPQRCGRSNPTSQREDVYGEAHEIHKFRLSPGESTPEEMALKISGADTLFEVVQEACANSTSPNV